MRDHEAFTELHDRLLPRLHHELCSTDIGPRLTRGIVAATFVEVWWLAVFHTAIGTDVQDWICRIAIRRVEEWKIDYVPDSIPPGPRTWIADGAANYYDQAHLELDDLLDHQCQSRLSGHPCESRMEA